MLIRHEANLLPRLQIPFRSWDEDWLIFQSPCHGDETRKVEIDALSMQQIQEVIDKLSYTGIMTIIQVMQKDLNDDELIDDVNPIQTSYNILEDSVKNIDSCDDNDLLKNYNFKIKVGDNVFCIFFDIII